jgi:ABC-2 type transport system permease protein
VSDWWATVADGRQQAHTTWWFLTRVPARYSLGFRMDLAFVLRSPGLAIYYLALDAILIPASGATTFLLAERLTGLGSWSVAQVTFLLGYATLVEGILAVAFTYNVSHISRRIGRGQFDHLLVQPQPLWLSLLSEGFAPVTGGAAVAMGIAILAWSITRLPLDTDVAWWGFFLANLGASVVAVLGAMFAWSSLAFWAPVAAEEVATNVHEALTTLGVFPLDGLGTVLTAGLVAAVPAGLVAWLPARALLGVGATATPLWATPAAAVALAIIGAATFRVGLGRYRCVGSSRYTDFGHRR